MDISKAFDDLQREVNAPIESVREARRRRDLFRDAFAPEDDVVEVFPSGSLARGSQKDPINDVDVVIVFHQDARGAQLRTRARPGPSRGK